VKFEKMSGNYWLFLEKSDKKHLFRSVEGDLDNTGKTYSCQTSVPNSKNLAVGDSIVLRRDNEILGIGTIESISEEGLQKVLIQCPECDSTDIRERLKKTPKWKCGKCASEFAEPKETSVEVRSYVATIKDFSQLSFPPSVEDVKLCAASGDGILSQLSIIRLDEAKIRTLLEAAFPVPSTRNESCSTGGQGFGLSPKERKTVELHAMGIARDLYEKDGWKVIDTSASKPYDLHVSKDGEERYVEVKGTTGGAESIILTRNEVDHVRDNPEKSALCVVSEIKLDPSGEKWIASGGKVSTHETRWTIDESQLEATQYKYRIG
jgi:ribosomal protein L37AE/L43A